MKPTALVAHPHPIVADALAALVGAAGYTVVRVLDAAAAAAALETAPALALIAAAFEGAKARAPTRTLILGDAARDGVVSLTATAHEIAAIVAGTVAAGSSPALTPRERDVARLVAAGQRNRSIAASLGISEGTVKMHLHNVYTKLKLESRTQLAMSPAAR